MKIFLKETSITLQLFTDITTFLLANCQLKKVTSIPWPLAFAQKPQYLLGTLAFDIAILATKNLEHWDKDVLSVGDGAFNSMFLETLQYCKFNYLIEMLPDTI